MPCAIATIKIKVKINYTFSICKNFEIQYFLYTKECKGFITNVRGCVLDTNRKLYT